MKWNFRIVEKPSYKECKQMLKMIQESFGMKAETIYFFKIFADFGKIYTTYDNEIPICVIQTLKDWNDVRRVQIVSIAVHPNYQRKGVAIFTVEEMIKSLKSEGIRSVGIRVTPNHEPMLKIFQRKLGFSVLKKMEDYYGLNKDRLYLEKKI
ncbi:MAG: GNAT family N-acetyltransferase [Candidatus Nealsonbacteria bacterium]